MTQIKKSDDNNHINMEKKHCLLSISKYLLIFLLLTGIQLGMLVLVAGISGKSIQARMIQSADFLSQKQVFFNIDNSDYASRIDRYADSILLGIIYSYDSDNPLSSVMRSSYYHTETNNENANLKEAVYNGLEPNYDYSRYWHGSAAVIRPLLVLFNLKQIYIINAVILSGLLITMLILIKKYFNTGVAVCFFISAVSVSVWYVPFSLEYTWNFYIMLISAFLVILGYKKGKIAEKTMCIFFVTGSMTAYFDFLTTETLTLLIPLIFLLLMEYDTGKLNSFKSGLFTSFKAGILWGIGYISSWLAKWTLASIILGENAFRSAFSNAAIRIYGESDNVSGLSQCMGAVIRNLSCIFPFSRINENGYVLCIAFFTLLFIIYYLIKKDKSSCFLPGLLMLLSLIPYVRFLVLSNHSYMHYFFTFRAQMTTMFCIGLAFYYGTDRILLKKEWKKLWKKNPKKK